MIRLLIISTLLLFSCIAVSQNNDTISVFFDLDNRSDFSKTELKARLDKISKTEGQVIGYTDYLGSAAYNNRLSEDRAKTVAKYIAANWAKQITVTKIAGMGELPTENQTSVDGDSKSRRVDVIFLKSERIKTQIVQESENITIPFPSGLEALDIDTSIASNVVLEGVEFIPGRHYPIPESREKLDQLSVTMKKYTTLNIEIQGFICCDYTRFDGMDNDTQTMNLSENRAKFIYDFLIREGIDEARLSYKGYGSSKPKVFPETNEPDRQANRRVEISIMK